MLLTKLLCDRCSSDRAAPEILTATGCQAMRLPSRARRPMLPLAWLPLWQRVQQLWTPPSLWPQATNSGRPRRVGLVGGRHAPAAWQTAEVLHHWHTPSVQPPPRLVVLMATRCWRLGCTTLLGSSSAADRPWVGPPTRPTAARPRAPSGSAREQPPAQRPNRPHQRLRPMGAHRGHYRYCRRCT